MPKARQAIVADVSPIPNHTDVQERWEANLDFSNQSFLDNIKVWKNSQSELAEPGHSRLGQSIEYNEGFRDEDLTHQLLSSPKQQFKIGVDTKLNLTVRCQ